MGIEQGEDRATKTIALNLLRKNISLETIAEVTGLTIEQLQQLQTAQGNG
jgi:predicted transposase/invertase (TIGR01784 family)